MFPDLHKGRTARELAADFARSMEKGFISPVVWDDTPDCEPVFDARTRRPIVDVQTGGAL